MASKKKLLQAAAGSAGGAGLDIDEVFSTYLYDGTGANLTITNGIDLSGEGGLVWIKSNQARANALFDTERGVGKVLISNESAAQANQANALTAFNSNGFSLGIDDSDNVNKNYTGNRMAAWTFRKAPKFFDVVTYTGNSTSGRQIAHNLGAVPGMMIIKKTSGSGGWRTYHRGANGGTNPENYYADLNDTAAFSSLASVWNQTAPTATHFTLGDQIHVNQNGETFVAYLFAHNNSDGEFGPDSDADIIKCGSYTGNSSASGPSINLGFEPQWVIIKKADNTENWYIYDSMRGVITGPHDNGLDRKLIANSSSAEGGLNYNDPINFGSTGFNIGTTDNELNNNGSTYIYMAIRRGSLNKPDDATKVFAIDYANGSDIPAFQSGFPVDMGLFKQTTGTGTFRISSRLTQGEYLETSETNAAQANSNYNYAYQNGFFSFAYSSAYLGWMWKRAPSYFDVVAYTGNGTAGRTVSHNLGVAPEMMWVKKRNAAAQWAVYHSAITADKYMHLDNTDGANSGSFVLNGTEPTSSVFTVGDNDINNLSGGNYIAYLFATVAGVSKVGSFTSTGSDMTIDCGFSNGARFVLLKKTNATDQWYLWDSVRGIVSGNDSRLKLNDTTAAVSHSDNIDPDNSGFILHDNILGGSGNTFIFYAIA